jgi:hypothetical protein
MVARASLGLLDKLATIDAMDALLTDLDVEAAMASADSVSFSFR